MILQELGSNVEVIVLGDIHGLVFAVSKVSFRTETSKVFTIRGHEPSVASDVIRIARETSASLKNTRQVVFVSP